MIEEFEGIIPVGSYFFDLPDMIFSKEDYKELIEKTVALLGKDHIVTD